MEFRQKFLRKILTLLLPFFVASCTLSPKLPDTNAAFESKYGVQVGRIKAERGIDTSSKVSITQSSSPYDINAGNINTASDPYSYVDVNKFNDRAPQIYLPNGESYEQSRATNPGNSLPENMFEITYNLGVYPPFRRAGAEFDRINIPPQDAYGVKTQMSEKSYLLAGNDALQKSVDQINNDKTSDDISNSQVLIKEQKELRRQQQMKNNFGETEIQMVALADKPSKTNKVEASNSDKKLPSF